MQNVARLGRFIRSRQGVFLVVLLLGVCYVALAQGSDPFEEAGQQGCTVISFIFRGSGAAILLGVVWGFALWRLFSERGSMWGLAVAIVVSLIVQFAPAFIGFFAPAVTATCFS
jgi:hypothetical protein